MDLDDDTYQIKSLKFYGYDKAKIREFMGEQVFVHHLGSKYTNKIMYERQDIAYDIVKKDMEDVVHIAFENYAFGKQGTRSLVQLGEFIGGMKKLFYDMGKGIVLYPPKTVKKFATGNGNADKVLMCDVFQKTCPHLYPEEFSQFKNYESPLADMVDAFWIAETLRNHLIYDILGTEALEAGIVGLLESKSTKKTDSIVETPLVRKDVGS
jgi:Holliday junction resolvasome RuvABC endonuclease subunit